MAKSIIKLQYFIASSLIALLFVSPISAALPETPVAPTAPTPPAPTVTVPALPALPVAPTEPVAPSTTTTSDKTDAGPTQTGPVVGAATPTVGGSVTAPGSLGSNVPASSVQNIAGPTVVGNDNTGSGSSNIAGLGPLGGSPGSSSNNITNNNNGSVSNNVGTTATTGGNAASYNTGNGSVVTGKANVVLSILNFINTAIVALPGANVSALFSQIMGNLVGNFLVDPTSGEAYSLTGSRLDVGNTNTGANSNNFAMINVGGTNTVVNNNNGSANNNIKVGANTGGNSASYNTGNGSITTGDANVALNLMNFLNSSIVAGNSGLLGVVNIFGNWLGNLVVPDSLTGGLSNLGIVVANDHTGAGSNNNATVDASNSTNVTNNNSAGIVNNITAESSTGANESSFNTGNGGVKTGASAVDLAIGNTANQNIIGDGAFIMLINVLGSWNGLPIGGPIVIASKNLLPGLTAGIMNVKNSDTGAGSNNKAQIYASNSNKIENNNNAKIGNNISLTAETGGNKSSYNTGSGGVTTGNANIMGSILNLANINVQASKVVMMVVNVFGDWFGNLSNTNTQTSGLNVSQVANISASDNVTHNIVGDFLFSKAPTEKNLEVHFTPKNGTDGSVKIYAASTGSHNTGVGTMSTGNRSGNENALAVFLQKYGTYLFGFLLILYAGAVGFGAYRKKRVINNRT